MQADTHTLLQTHWTEQEQRVSLERGALLQVLCKQTCPKHSVLHYGQTLALEHTHT